MIYRYELCSSRHETPAHGRAIFPNEIANPMDFGGLEKEANKNLPEDCTCLLLYVTGLTPALIAVLNVCRRRMITVTLKHFNRDDSSWISQPIVDL